MGVCLAAHTLLRQEVVIMRSTGAVAVLFRALAACVRAATAAAGDALRMQAPSGRAREM
jgi:hypothetical protein